MLVWSLKNVDGLQFVALSPPSCRIDRSIAASVSLLFFSFLTFDLSSPGFSVILFISLNDFCFLFFLLYNFCFFFNQLFLPKNFFFKSDYIQCLCRFLFFFWLCLQFLWKQKSFCDLWPIASSFVFNFQFLIVFLFVWIGCRRELYGCDKKRCARVCVCVCVCVCV